LALSLQPCGVSKHETLCRVSSKAPCASVQSTLPRQFESTLPRQFESTLPRQFKASVCVAL
jgi:hypothetical protein